MSLTLPPTAVKRARPSTVAGYYYPRHREELAHTLIQLLPPQEATRSALGVVVPHGSWAFSGSVAGRTLSRIHLPRRVIVLAPNHTGLGHAWSVMSSGAYATPLGDVPIDEALAEALLRACPLFAEDHTAHWPEHAIEVLLPFLQSLGPADLAMVPIVIDSTTPTDYQHAGEAIARVVKQSPEPVLLMASADLTHYEPHERVRATDELLLASVQSGEAARWIAQLRDLRIATCAEAPVACLLEATRRLGATHTELVSYATSAEAGGDPHSVIGYAGLLIQ